MLCDDSGSDSGGGTRFVPAIGTPQASDSSEGAESIDLLLRTGQVEEPDEAANEAAGRIAALVGHLPLYISICGGIICDYEGGVEWQQELPELLPWK